MKLNWMNPCIRLCAVGCAVVSLSGCHSSDVGDSLATGSIVVAATPVVASYGVAYGAHTSTQGSLVAVGAPEQLYSQQVTFSELRSISMRHGHKFHEPWKYMGTKDGEHYLMLYPFAWFREIYRIDVDEFPISEPFELTSRSSKWREITSLSNYGYGQDLIIEPLLFEQPEGFQLIPVGGWRIDGVAGEVEDQFMQEVQILELAP